MSTPLHYVSAEELLLDSFRLGRAVYQSGFRPRHAVSIWRGGTPVGLGVDAFFRSRGVTLNHSTIATASYLGIGRQGEVTVKNLEHLVQMVCPEDGLLLIDDVYETGNTVRRVVERLQQRARANTPKRIVVATVHRKPGREQYTGLPLVALRQVPGDTWIDYPHELADLVDDDDPDDAAIRQKDEAVWSIVRGETPEPRPLTAEEPYIYRSARQLMLDALGLGVIVARDPGWWPDVMVALWPDGVHAGLPVHEVLKYARRKAGAAASGPDPDHICVTTSPTRRSTASDVLGLGYLEARVNEGDNVLIVDTTFRAGRLVNDLVIRLKEVLRRNLDHRRVRVASVYYNPDDDSTWTVRPDIKKPHYYLRTVDREVIYASAVHKLPHAPATLRRLNPALWRVLYGDLCAGGEEDDGPR